MLNQRLITLLTSLISIIALSACVAVMDATSDKPLQIDPGKRSLGDKMDDRQLRTVISVNIKKASPQLEKAHVNVHSYNSVILLTGEAPSKALRELSGTTARQVNRVRQVYNELTIGPKTAFLSRANDEWIESKIKSKLIFNADIDSSRVKVICEDNTVYLMGLLDREQAQKITEVVRKTRGVNKVVRAIEYIESIAQP